MIVPNYNHVHFLPKRLESILAQTVQDFELIVLDDASTDGSAQLLQKLAQEHPMQLVINSTNSGSPFAQWKKGALLARGKYLWIAESDDYADRRFLEKLIEAMEKNPAVGLAYSQSFQVTKEGLVGNSCEEWNRTLNENRWKTDYTNAGRDEVARFLVIHNSIPNASAVLVRKDLFLRALAGTEGRRLAGDWWTWVRVLLESDIAFVAEPLNYYRMHDQSVRDTTKMVDTCREELSVKAYICSQVPVAAGERRRTFHEQMNKWRKCVKSGEAQLNRATILQMLGDARKISMPGALRMAACYFKAKLINSAA